MSEDGRFRLDGQHAVVAGASRGIGAAAALALADAGAARVTLLARSASELEAVAAGVRERGAAAAAVPCDVTDDEQVATAFAPLEPVDLLVCSAGANQPEPFLAVEAATLDRLWRLNVRATFVLAQHAVRGMLAGARGGTVVCVSSQMGHVGAPQRTVYCATKHAVEGLTKALAVELAPHGIRVVSVAPTFVETPMTAPFFADPAVRADVERRIPLGRVGTTDEVVGAIVFAASPAARLVTGTSLVVDGGWTAQ